LRAEWINDIAYQGLVRELKNDEKLLTPVEGIYPNWEESEHDGGYWDKNAFQDETQFGTIIDWLNNPIMMWQSEGRGDANEGWPSTENDHFAATMEKAIDEIHPDAEVRASHVTQPGGHGTYALYSPLENIEGESHWMYINTTGEASAPIPITSDEIIPEEYYNPFIEGYPADTEQFDRENINDAAVQALRTMVAPGHTPEGYEFDKMSIDDRYLESFYGNEETEGWVEQDNKADPVITTLERAIYKQIEKDEEVTVTGTVEQPKIDGKSVDVSSEVPIATTAN
jgi:hypothetical protein